MYGSYSDITEFKYPASLVNHMIYIHIQYAIQSSMQLRKLFVELLFILCFHVNSTICFAHTVPPPHSLKITNVVMIRDLLITPDIINEVGV
jgi:hypothetical protein